jgi:RimJ/RimL family protein N-acetyltransferase
VKLIPVDPANEQHVRVTWDVLAQRRAEENISHREMPTLAQHCRFLAKHPYEAFNVIEVDDVLVGKIYLTFPPAAPSLPGNEIGFDILREHQRKGYASQAIKLLMQMHGPRRYIFNVNPKNEASRALIESLGGSLCQHTYELEAA